jgi:hypothetical protein
MPGVDLRVVRADGSDALRGETGEIWMRTDSIMSGYLNDEDATNAAFENRNWYRSGDVARLDDDGHLFIVDRLKDMIITGGENRLFEGNRGCPFRASVAASDRKVGSYRNDRAKNHADRCAALTCFISIFLTFGSGVSPAAFFKRSNSSARSSVSFSISGTAVRHAMRPKSRLSR